MRWGRRKMAIHRYNFGRRSNKRCSPLRVHAILGIGRRRGHFKITKCHPPRVPTVSKVALRCVAACMRRSEADTDRWLENDPQQARQHTH